MTQKDAIRELKSLSEKGIYKKSKLKWWLQKYADQYTYFIKGRENRDAMAITYRADARPEVKEFIHLENKINTFLDTYETLENVIELYANETYYKEQIVAYNKVKNNVSELNNWLATQYLDTGKQQSDFKILFGDNRELIDYSFKIHFPLSLNLSLIVDGNEFQYSLQFLNILERSKKIIIIGVITLFSDLEVFEESRITEGDYIRIRPAFKRQKIVVSTNDEHLNEHLIIFRNGKTELLKDVSIGQKIKVFASLRGGEWENENKELAHRNSLLGWDIELE
jgi:hypothetical protein